MYQMFEPALDGLLQGFVDMRHFSRIVIER